MYLQASFFSCDVLLSSQRIQKRNKKWKVPIFFSRSSSGMPYILETPKIDVTTYDKCRKKFTTYGWHHDMFKTCLQKKLIWAEKILQMEEESFQHSIWYAQKISDCPERQGIVHMLKEGPYGLRWCYASRIKNITYLLV